VGQSYDRPRKALHILGRHTTSSALKTNRWPPTNFPVRLMLRIEKSLINFNKLKSFLAFFH